MTKKISGFIVIVALAGGVILFNKFYNPAVSETAMVTQADSAQALPAEVKEPKMLYGMIVQDDHLVIEDKIKRNQFLGDILQEYNVPAKLIHQVSQLSRKVFDPRKITPNSKYTLICNQDSVRQARAFVYEPNAIDYIIFRFDDSLSVDVGQREVTTIEKTV